MFKTLRILIVASVFIGVLLAYKGTLPKTGQLGHIDVNALKQTISEVTRGDITDSIADVVGTVGTGVVKGIQQVISSLNDGESLTKEQGKEISSLLEDGYSELKNQLESGEISITDYKIQVSELNRLQKVIN